MSGVVVSFLRLDWACSFSDQIIKPSCVSKRILDITGSLPLERRIGRCTFNFFTVRRVKKVYNFESRELFSFHQHKSCINSDFNSNYE